MAAPVISHQRPRRKRGAGRRFGALAVTLVALAVASWLAPYVYPPLARLEPPVQRAVALSPKLPGVIKVVARADAPTAQETRGPRRHSRSPVSLNAAPESIPDEVEVLSPDELDAISQARD